MCNKLPATKINKQTDTEKEIDKVTDNKDDRRIHRKVFICKKKFYNKLLTHVGYQIKTASEHNNNNSAIIIQQNTDKTQRQRQKKNT